VSSFRAGFWRPAFSRLFPCHPAQQWSEIGAKRCLQGCSTSCRWPTATTASRGRLAALAKLDLLVIDDFAISPMEAAERNDLLELLDDRVGTRSTLITSQLPVKAWHTYPR